MTFTGPTDYQSLGDFDPAPTKAQLESERRKPPAPPPTDDRRQDAVAWQDYIAREAMKAARKECNGTLEAVGEVMGKERKAHLALKAEVATLREQVATMAAEHERQLMALRVEFLTIQLDEARGQKRRIA